MCSRYLHLTRSGCCHVETGGRLLLRARWDVFPRGIGDIDIRHRNELVVLWETFQIEHLVIGRAMRLQTRQNQDPQGSMTGRSWWR